MTAYSYLHNGLSFHLAHFLFTTGANTASIVTCTDVAVITMSSLTPGDIRLEALVSEKPEAQAYCLKLLSVCARIVIWILGA